MYRLEIIIRNRKNNVSYMYIAMMNNMKALWVIMCQKMAIYLLG